MSHPYFFRTAFFLKIQFYILLFIIFLLPFSRVAIPPLIIAFSFFWLISGNLKEKLTTVFKNPIGILLTSFYLIHIVGMLWTNDYPKGRFDLEVKFSLFLFPLLIFGSSTLFKERYIAILWCFVIANFVSSLSCFIYIIYKSFSQHHPIYNYWYTDFSLFMHPSYGSMFVLFSMSIIICFLFYDKAPIWKKQDLSIVIKWVMIVLLIFFSAVIYFYSSRAGLISTCAVLTITICYLLLRRGMKTYWKIIAVTSLLLMTVLSIHYNPRFEVLTKFIQSNPHVNYRAQESVSVRYAVFLQSIELVKNNFLVGVGTGDVKDVLMQEYRDKHIVLAEEKQLNTHNQFLETTLGLGILGGIFLLATTLIPLILGIKYGNMLAIFFSIIIITNFLFESMLNVQFGVVFYSFFNSLIIINLLKA